MKKSEAPVGVIILAAGLGKRMHSPLPKVLHEIGGQPLLCHLLDRVNEVLPKSSIAIVVGHQRETVEASIRSRPEYAALDLTFVHQPEQKGTGHAARCAMDSSWGEQILRKKGAVLILPGDLPLVPGSLIQQIAAPLRRAEVLRLLTSELPDPTGYGRVVRRGKKGGVLRIVEEKDATPREKTISEVAASIYLFQAAFLRFALQRLSNQNAQGEYYLTDLIAQASRTRKKHDILVWTHPEDLRGVNDPWELAIAGRILNERIVREWARRGAKFVDPLTTWIDVGVTLGAEAVISPGVILSGKTRIGARATLGPNVVLKDVTVGEGANVKTGTTAESSEIGERAQIGPYAHLRPESAVGIAAKIGNFVELKKTSIGDNSSVAHLSYLGDAQVGRNVNIGCGFVTCNFDGRIIDGQRKHRTVIEDDVFLGSDCQAVAPVRIGRGAYVASGSTITEDVEAESLAIARTRQVNKPGYARKLKEK
ncbi:MAG: UDP-N-acetylglucosamine diphosphorylase/glucosamine-1-phosphate N-acetyltransferase [Bdellovibrionales bacterium RIFOXYC1_FULL_54_43]|nr:MAG: UDP-N-acetylglucosamine diphosphorylase/glucosamine-1-phosphate N-acetyltransferase [Bdellovibrionales bacterium RIFOXYC1_FULL_54_43]OFZ81562.1 MAG: UDP-N-acetylglucosamine diphosphorylase/glucosamine-1-phosphate N-acetyltransferase [Bdellovibrionales bacterium RIFOXYD1_FULL_55_31]